MNFPGTRRVDCRPLSQLDAPALRAWHALHEAHAGCGGAFLSPAYAQAAQASQRRDVRVLMVWQDTVLTAVMALQRQPGGWGRCGLFEPVGGEMTDYAGLLAVPGFRTDWADVLRCARVPCLYFTHLDESQREHGLDGGQPRTGLRTVIHADGGPAHWEHLRLLDRKLVSDTERRERKLAQTHGPLVFEMRSSTPEEDLARLVELKNSQYRRTGKTEGALLQEDNVRLLQMLLRDGGPGCRALLSTLKVDGQMVAAHLGLVAGPILHYWFPVYDERFSAYSPGRVLLHHVLLAAAQEGIQVIDRGEGDTQAKRDFANQSHEYHRGLVAAGLQGRLLSLCRRVLWKLRSN